jgi:hypothetical protein
LLRFVIEDEEEEGDSDTRVRPPIAEGVLDSGRVENGLAVAGEAIEL